MGLAVGDYVQLSRRIPPLHRAGLRGTVSALAGDWATILLPQGGRFEAPFSHLTLLVRGETL